MKKSIITVIAAVILAGTTLTATAQPRQGKDQQKPTPEQIADRQAANMANELMLSDKEAEAFIPVYKAYKMEIRSINQQYRPAKKSKEEMAQPLTDNEVKEQLEKNFEKSQKVLDARKAYYQKFLNVLSPKQIKKMYELEKQQGNKGPAKDMYGAGHRK